MSSRIIFLLAVVLALQVHVNLSVVKCPKLPECPEQEKKGCFEDDDCPASTNNYDYKCCPTPSKLGCNVKRVCKAIRRPEFRDVKCPKLPECPDQEEKRCFEDDDCPAPTNNYDYKCCPTPSNLGCHVGRVCTGIRR